MARPTQADITEREADAMNGMKRCSTNKGCGQLLPHAEFHKSTGFWDGLYFRCKTCQCETMRVRNEAAA